MANNYLKTITDLKAGKLKPVYLIHGTEPYYIDKLADKIQEIAIPEHEKGFNEYVLYGKDISTADIVNNARKFPMMAERQLILVREAQAINDIENKDAQKLLENYAKNPLPSTILVLAFGKAQNETRTWVKAFKEQGEIYNYKKIYDSEIPNFIRELCEEKSLKISPKAVQMLTEFIGNNLQALDSELDKIRINLKEGDGIDADIIEKFVGVSKEYNVFELQKALVDRDFVKSFKIVQYFADNTKDHPVTMNIIALYMFFSKVVYLYGIKSKPDQEIAQLLGINPFFIRDYKRAAQVFSLGKLRVIIAALRRADAKSKGVEAGESSTTDLYHELILNILQ